MNEDFLEEMTMWLLDKDGEPVKRTISSRELVGGGFSSTDKIVAKSQIGGCVVSTCFLFSDYSWGDGGPIFWETLVFGGELADEQERCGGKRADARAMHKRMCLRAAVAEYPDEILTFVENLESLKQ